MAENQFPSTVDALFKGMDHFITSKTVVGEPVKVDENTTIIPLVDVTCGMAAGSFAQSAKTNGGGGMSAKMSPSAILVIQNGMTKLVNIKHQDAVTKVLDMLIGNVDTHNIEQIQQIGISQFLRAMSEDTLM